MNALEALRYDWGGAYEIENDDDEWRARRIDGLGGWIEAGSPDDVRNQIFSDYAVKPVRLAGILGERSCTRKIRKRALVVMVNPVTEQEAGHEIAGRLQEENPLWLVVFGVYTQQFVCFPKFEAPGGTFIVAAYPGALPGRMRRAEEAARRAQEGGTGSQRPYAVMA